MTDRIRKLLKLVREGQHHAFRWEAVYRPVEVLEAKGMSNQARVTERFEEVLLAEKPVILQEQELLFVRTVKNLPPLFTQMEWEDIRKAHFLHEQGRVCNISPNYARVIQNGLDKEKELCSKAAKEWSLRQGMEAADRLEWQSCVTKSIDAVLKLAERYRLAAIEIGKTAAAEVLSQVPSKGARTFREALQFLRILHYALWCEGEYHNTLGRLDVYLYPYLKADLESGYLTKEDAYELLEEFFISCNLDSDLYPGIQQGDNGQSLMLGGVDEQGNDVFNLLSEMCLKASGELLVIDPKINLRVNKNTPLSVYREGTRLTRAGLGFPQYSNDDVVIPGLLKKGYRLEDARNYTVAACWEFIIPSCGMDIPNIDAVNFPKLVNDTVLKDLAACKDYEAFYQCFTTRLKEDCEQRNRKIHNLYMIQAPFLSLMMDGCVEECRDISYGSRYNNFGFHGVGISTAVDSLAVIKKCIYEEKNLTKQEALDFLEHKEGSAKLAARLRYEEPKFGDDDELTNQIAVRIFADFGKATEGLTNERGGCIRGGTGSAMLYLWYADHLNSTLSGHQKGDSFSANYAPELFVKNKGPLSVIASLTKPDFTEVINGGPMTMEFHSSVFREEEGVDKVASLVMQFIHHGGHQLQLNSVNRELLLLAQKEPENYKNLIVRIWGWSAYFVELDREYQDHVIARQEFLV